MSDYATRTPAKTAAKPAAATLRPAQPGAWRAPRPTTAAARPAPAAKAPIRQPAPTPAARVPAVAPAKATAPPAVAPNVVAATLEAALDWMPDVLRDKVSAGARDFDGYPLLTLLLGYDLFTHKPVARTPQALLEALLRFSDEGTQLYQAVVKSGVLAQAGQLIRANAQRFHLGSDRVLGLLDQILAVYHAHSLGALVFNPGLLLEPLRGLGRDVLRFARAVGPPLLELILPVLGPRAQDVIKLLKKGQATFKQIIRNPKAFLNNLVDGVKLGFRQFADHAGQHLANSFMDWLLGAFKEDGVSVPKPLNMEGLFRLGLSLLGLSYDNLRAKLVKRMGKRGEAVMGALETAAGLVRTLVTKGPKAVGQELLDMASAQLGKLKEQVFDGLRSWLQKTLLLEGVKQLASLLTPATALLESLHKAYTTVVFFIERAERFQRLLTTIVDAFADIANRVLKPAADKVEGTLGQLLTLALDFFMRLIGLKDVPKEVKAQIMKARNWIDETIDKYLDKFIEMAVKLFNKGKAAVKKAVGSLKGWLGLREKFELPNGEKHTLFFKGKTERAELMVASTPTDIETYLDTHPKKGTAEWKQAMALAKNLETLADEYELAEKGEDQTGKMQELAVLLGQLGGNSNLEGHLPDSPGNKDGKEEGGLKASVIELLSTKGPGKQADLGSQSPDGWELLKGEGMTYKTEEERDAKVAKQIWVRMHLVSQMLGGLPEEWNLTPAPTGINTGAVLTFENQVKRLTVAKKDPNDSKKTIQLPNVVWMRTMVTAYHDNTLTTQQLTDAQKDKYKHLFGRPLFAEKVAFSAGMYFYDPKNPAMPWKKEKKPLLSLEATLPVPTFTGTWKPNINTEGEETLQAVLGCSLRMARAIKSIQKASRTPYLTDRDLFSSLEDYRNNENPNGLKRDVSLKNFDDNFEKVKASMKAGAMKYTN